MIKEQRRFFNQKQKEGRLEIIYYTDPLCSWSWAFEPQWRRLRYEFYDIIKWRYCMGGMIADWKNFNDPMNSVTKPAQMGPLWMETTHISGMPIDNSIWIKDYPSSSYPSCIAFKTAEMQSREAAELYLRALREAVMLKALNIAKGEVLIQLANEVADDAPSIFDAHTFVDHFKTEEGQKRFIEDLKEVRYHQVGRFPTLIIKNTVTGKAVIIVGYRPYKVLLEAIVAVAPDLTPVGAINIGEYKEFWGKVNERELKEIEEAAVEVK